MSTRFTRGIVLIALFMLCLTAGVQGAIILDSTATFAPAPTANMTVTCQSTGQALGTINVTLTPTLFRYTNTTTGKTFTNYGAVISGGFTPAPGCDATYRWIQAVNTNKPLYPWAAGVQAKSGGYYYDRRRVDTAPEEKIADGSPFYKFYRGPGNGYPLGFEDAPQRGASDLPFTMTFNTALVCVSGNNISIVGGFSWTFSWAYNPMTLVNSPSGQAISQLSTPADFNNLVAAWNNDPDQADLGGSWNLINNGTCCCCDMPLPASMPMGVVLLISMGAGTAVRRRAA